jgi:hypothetical protein
MNAVVIAPRGAQKVEREGLSASPSPTPTAAGNVGVHAELVNAVEHYLQGRAIPVARAQYAVQRPGHLLCGVLDLVWQQTAEFGAALGLRTAHDSTAALSLWCGVRGRGGDNLVFSGAPIVLAGEPTAGVALPAELAPGIERCLGQFAQVQAAIHRLKGDRLSAVQARGILFTLYARGIMPLTTFRQVAPAFIQAISQEFSGWDLLNACTRALGACSPAGKFEATTALGQFFHVE